MVAMYLEKGALRQMLLHIMFLRMTQSTSLKVLVIYYSMLLGVLPSKPVSEVAYLETGRYIVEDSSRCDKFCTSTHCCHGTADCRCGTTTGKYECVCRPGYYGTGLENDGEGCSPCPSGTYKNEALPGNEKSCIPCPDPKMNSPSASVSLDQCLCEEGFKKVNASCQALMCEDISPPENGYLLDCDRGYKSHCTSACNVGYDLQGTATVKCGKDERWRSDNRTDFIPATCQVRYCEALQAPESGHMLCSKSDNSYGTACNFHCDEGYRLHGSGRRTCESQRKWTGADAECWQITCPSLPVLSHGNFSGECPTTSKAKFGDSCSFTCPASGYELLVAETVTCGEDGDWFPAIPRENFKICNDTVPPVIICPENFVISTSPRSPFGRARWEPPFTSDNSDTVNVSPEFELPVSLRIGAHTISYVATDDSGLSARCNFTITVEDDEPPMIDSCVGPKAFAIERGELNSGLIEWTEPTFSDNSGSVEVKSNRSFGIFPRGKTVVAYTATDAADNERTCYIEIHVRDNTCPYFEEPRRGKMHCYFPSDDEMSCDLSCLSERDGFAMTKDGNLHFTCDRFGWRPQPEFPLDCSKQKYSNNVLKDFQVAYSIGSASCNDSSFLDAVQQYFFEVFSREIPRICEGRVDGLLTCKLISVEVKCITTEVEVPEAENPPDDDPIISDPYGYGYGYDYQEDERKRRKRSLRLVKGKRIKRSEEAAYYDADASYADANYPVGDEPIPPLPDTLDADVGYTFDGAERVPDYPGVANAIQEVARDIIGDIIPDEILDFEGGNTATQDKVQVHLTIGAEVPLEGTNDARDRSRHTRMVEFIRNVEIEELFVRSHSFVDGEWLNATDAPDLTLDGDSYSSSQDELTCPLGTMYKDRAFCVNCPVGTFYNVLSGRCESCPIGFYQDLEAQLSCQPCPSGTSNVDPHARDVEECLALCAPGYMSETGLADCKACAVGSFADTQGAKVCTLCPPGNGTIGIAADSLDDCGELCKPGYVSLTGFAPCQPCPLGTYQDSDGQTYCHVCPGNEGRVVGEYLICVERIPGLERELGKLYYDECFSKPCKNNASCTAQQNTFHCECLPGYTGKSCEIEIDECLSSPCAETSNCTDLLNGFRCDCDAGYAGLLCNQEIDECSSAPCHYRATCVDRVDSFSCDCENGYSGLLCEINVDECDSDPCLNNGICIDEIAAFHCECKVGYTGAVCQTDIDDCADNPCLNAATCVDGINEFRCVCAAGFRGDFCGENIDECASDPCVYGECLDLVDSYKCVCPPTYLGVHCDEVGDPYFDLGFNRPNTYHHSRIDYALTNMTEVTISLYLKSNSTETYGTPFSYAVGDGLEADTLALTDLAALTFYVNGEFRVTDLKRINDGKWYFLTVTWTSEGGEWSVYLDGTLEDSGKGLATGQTIPGGGVLVIGQEQDTLAGGFSASQEFLGTISQVNVYDYAMLPGKVLLLWRNCADNTGNVRAWPEFAGGIVGRLEKTSTRFCLPCAEISSDEGTIVRKNEDHLMIVSCATGYKPLFHASNRPRYPFWCGNDAKWRLFTKVVEPEKIKCEKITCGDIGSILLGSVIFTDGKYGDVANYRCESGYEPIGDAQRTCQANTRWSGTPPTCEDIDECNIESSCHRKANCTNSVGNYSCECVHGWKGDGYTCREIDCGSAGSLIFGSIQGNNFKLGGVVQYSCDYGYRLEGPSERVCLYDDSWSEHMPECVKVECEEPEDIRYGYKKPRASIWDYKSQITYFCQPGYYLIGEAIRECGPDSQWTGTPPTCDRVSCGEPPVVANSVRIQNGGVKYGDIVNYICEQGYGSLGPSKLTCNASKTWEGKDGGMPVCEHPTCDSPLSIIHGEFTIEEIGESTVTDATYTYDTAVRYTCNVGYNLVGAETIVCKEKGIWDRPAPVCEIVSCGPPPDVENSVQDHNGQLYGDLANYFCKPGYFLKGDTALSCLASGKWTDEKQDTPSCNPKPCPNPRHVPHSQQTLSNADGYVYKAIVSYQCDLGYWSSGTDTIDCDTENHWQPAQDFECDIAICPEPTQPQYGSVDRLLPELGESYEYNNTISYSCEAGFYSTDDMEARCTEHGTWSTPTPSCLPIECPMPATVSNSELSILDGPYGTGALYQSDLTYACNLGYEQTEGDAVRKCDSERSWTGIPPECSRVSCGEAPVVEHAFSVLQPYGPGASGGNLLYRDQVMYYCDTGFSEIGNIMVECTATEEFTTAPVCEAKSCGSPPHVAYASYEAQNVYGENVYQSRLTYTCERDFRMTGNPVRVCDEYGYWTTEDPPVCEPITCAEPESVKNSFQFVSSTASDVQHPDLYKSGKYQPRAAAVTACDKGYQILRAPQTKSAASLTDGTNTAVASDEEMARSVSPELVASMDSEKQDRVRKVLSKYLQHSPEVSALVFKSDGVVEPAPDTIHLRQCSETVGWLKSAPKCVPMVCSTPLEIENGHLVNAAMKTHRPTFQNGVEYTCDEGYRFADASAPAETRLSTCEWSDDRWNVYLTPVPQCVPLPCPAPAVIDHGSHSIPSGESFVFKDTVTYTCDNGYEMTSGSSTLSCESTQSWSGDPPVCSPVQCPEPVAPENGKVKGSKWFYESTVVFKCQKGYDLIGAENVTCQADRTWSAPNPSCNPVPCGPPPVVDNAQVSATSQVYSGCARYTCDYGYHLSGYSELRCTASRKWKKKPPICELTRCATPSLGEHVVYSDTSVTSPFLANGSYIYYDIITYGCEEGYETNDAASLSAECYTEANSLQDASCDNIQLVETVPMGQWSTLAPNYDIAQTPASVTNKGGPPLCTAKDCGSPPPPDENGIQIGKDTTFNSTVRYACKNGYFTVDPILYTVCLSNASWSRSTAPACQPVPCGTPDTPKNGYFNGTVFTYQGEIQYGCDDGHNLLGAKSITCLSNGNWSDAAAICEPKDCGELPLIQHGKLDFEDTIFGEEAIYACNDGYYLEGKSLFECRATGRWSHPTPPTCLPKSCGVLNSPQNGVVNATGHVFMATAVFSCNSGYYLEGFAHIECLSTALWSEELPHCIPVDCGVPDNVTNGHTLVPGPTTYKSHRQFGCDTGYEMIGAASIICQANKTWTTSPVCVRIRCPVPIIPNNGLISDGLKMEYRYEDRVSYSCKQGYFTNDVTNTECTSSRVWSNPPPTCPPVDCGELPSVDQGMKNGLITTFMSVVSFTCQYGYHIVGNSSLECLHTKLWSSDVPRCKRNSCGRPLDLKNGYGIGADNPLKWLYTEKVPYHCNEGYHLHGSNEAECDADGIWAFNYNEAEPDYDDGIAQPVCERISCEAPANLANGSFPSKEYYYGDVVDYKCNDGYDIEKTEDVVCTGTSDSSVGFYAGSQPSCLPVSCGEPKSVNNSQLEFDRITFNNNAVYTCDPGYNMIGESIVKCMADRHWSAAPKCVPKNCDVPSLPEYVNMTVHSTLFPTVLNVACETGYLLEGPSTMRCTEDGTWSNTGAFQCSPVPCGPPRNTTNGTVTTNGFVFKKLATYKCDVGFVMMRQDVQLQNNTVIIKCLSTGEWEQNIPSCFPRRCGTPPATANGTSATNSVVYYPEKVTYTCDYGFEFGPSTDSTIQCTASGKFSSPAPKCRPVSCGAPVAVPNAVVHAEANTYLRVAEYTCNFGYVLATESMPTEYFESQCTGDRNWTYVPATEGCVLYQCGPPLILQNAEVPPYTRDTRFGDTFTYECIKGHEAPEEDLSVTCERYGIWSEGPECQPVNCGSYACARNAECKSDGTIYESTVTSQCHKGYEYQPNVTEYEVHCQDDESWSTPNDIRNPTECVRLSCGDPPIIQNGNAVSQNDTNVNLFESKYQYECEAGYDLIGDVNSISCLSDGSWGPGPLPTCEAKDCGDPPKCIDNANCSHDSTTFQSQFSVSCNEGYEVEYDMSLISIECTEIGVWAIPPAEDYRCQRIECGNVPEIEDGQFALDGNSSARPKYQDQVGYKCNNGYDLIGEAEVTCLSDRSYTKVPSCTPVSCGTPVDVENGHRNVTGEIFESEAIYVCDTGYFLYGERNWVCSADTNWRPVVPIQSSPPVSNSRSLNIPGLSTHDMQVTFSESSGMSDPDEGSGSGMLERDAKGDKSVSSRSRRDAGEMVPADIEAAKTPECKPVPCAVPPRVQNAVKDFDTILVYGENVSYECKPGYEMIGDSTLTCQSSGQLGPSAPPTCVRVECPMPERSTDCALLGSSPFKFEDELTYRPRKGYEFHPAGPASMKITCTDQGTSSVPNLPSCKRVSCGQPIDIPNGEYSAHAFTYQSNATYSCDRGYEMQGKPIITCLSTRKWSSSPPSCHPVSCGALTATTHSKMELSHSEDPFTYQQSVNFTCIKGYMFDNVSVGKLVTATCQYNKKWDTVPPECVPVPCPELPPVENGGWTLSGDPVFKSTASYTCDIGYEMQGEPSMLCQATGSWSNEPPTCNPVSCDHAPIVPYSNHQTELELVYSQDIVYQCISGYELHGNDTLRCTEDRTFDNPSPVCSPVVCETPTDVKFGFYEESDEGIIYMSQLVYECNEGYEMISEAGGLQKKTVTCQANKKWSGGPPECRIKSCPELFPLRNGVAKYFSITYGSDVAYKCSEGYEISKTTTGFGTCGETEFCMTCQANAIWGSGNSEQSPELPECMPVDCREPPEMPDARSESTSLVYQGNTTYTCQEGYEFIERETVTITCQKDATWSVPSQLCQRVKCANPDEVEHGSLGILRQIDQDVFMYQDVVHYACDRGYEPSVIVNLTCGADKFWDSDPPFCNPVSCGHLPVREHGYPVTTVKKSIKTTFQSLVSYTCDNGYEFNGNSTDEEIFCTADGVWSSIPEPCTPIDCGNPVDIRNGYYTLLSNATKFRSKVQYSCDVGHELSGNSVLKCKSDKSWKPSNPECVPVSCSIPPAINHGYPDIGQDTNVTANLMEDPAHKPKKRDLSSVSRFVYQDTVSYSCEIGYKIQKGPAEARCDEEANWVDLPVCTIVECEPLPPGRNSRKLESSHTYDSVVTYECNEGYVLRDGSTSIDCKCRDNGYFSPVSDLYGSTVCRQSLPECTKVSCGPAPKLRHGLDLSGKNEYVYEDEVKYDCAKGYKMKGEDTLLCQSNGIYDRAPPRCRRISCGTTPSVENAVTFAQNGTKFGDVISYECRPGHKLVSDAFERTCTADGSWTEEVIQCDPISCGGVAPPENANIVTPNNTIFGSTLSFECQDGYNMIGRQSISCEASGEWSSFTPECMPIPCDPLPDVDFGIPYTDFMLHQYKDEVKFKCLDGFLMEGSPTISCLVSGSWTTPPHCYPVECPEIPYVRHASISNMQDTFTFMEMIFFECNFGFTLTSDDSARSCQANGLFSSEVITCDRIPCPAAPEVPHGSASTKNGVYGDRIQYKCDEGYENFGSESLVCSVNDMQGEWIGEMPECNAVACGSAPSILNGVKISEPDEYFFGDTVHYECLKGHEFHGPSVATCRADRRFSVVNITCQPVMCSDLVLTAQPRGIVKVENEGEPYSGDMQIPELRLLPDLEHMHSIVTYQTTERQYLSEAIVTCESGYVLKSGKSEEKFVCQADKIWDGNFVSSECVPVQCTELPILADGDIEFELSPEIANHENDPDYTRPNIYGTKAIFTCDDGYNLEGDSILACMEHGRWSSQAPRCSPVSCGTPPYIENSVPIESSFTYGMVAEYECAEKYVLADTKYITCKADGNFSNETIECLPILCPELPSTQHGVLRRNVSRVGDENDYICDEGYDSGSKVECLLSGQWSGGLDPCIAVKCPDVLELDNAILTNTGRDFSYGDTAEYACVPGHYRSDGSQTFELSCEPSGTFFRPGDVCSPVECNLTIHFQHGKLHHPVGVARYGDSADLSCDEGYLKFPEDKRPYCTDTGEWDDLELSCEIIKCGMAPVVDHAKPVLDADHVYVFNNIVRYHCDEGYEHTDPDAIVTCMIDGAIHGYENVLCEPVVCQIPDFIESGSLSKQEATFGQVLIIECIGGYVVEQSGEQDIALVCQADGQWDVDISVISCIPIICVPLEPLEFGSIVLLGDEDEIIINTATDDLVAGSLIQYRCDTGYTLEGVPRQQCTLEGMWTDTLPICNPVICGSPPIILHGVILGGNDYTYGNVISYECESGYRLYPEESSIRTCDEMGSWSEEHPVCKVISCDVPAPVENGKVDILDYNYGSEIETECDEGYLMTRGDALRACLANGSWSGQEPVCERSCGPHPAVERGVVEPENAMYVGDRVTVTCEEGNGLHGDPVRVCREDGEWEGVEPFCAPFQVKSLFAEMKPVYSCAPPELHSTKVKLVDGQDIKDHYDDGEVLEYCCASGYIPVANLLIQCQAGEWTGVPQCVVRCLYKCHNNGRCTANRRCTCSYGWEGARCQKPVCASRCLNGGYCTGPNLCSCKKGWTGTRCETPVCSKPCQNGGRCTAPDECYCPYGYGGVDCTESSFFNIW